MKKIITAINNPKLNEELKKENKFEIIGKDIQYKEAIIEVLEKNNNIDIIILSEKISGEIKLEKLIEKIKKISEKIKIIFILEKSNKDLEKILIKNKIIDIYYNNEINLNELIKIINKKEISMEEEIIRLKKIIEEKNNKNNKKNNIEKIKNILKKELINKIILNFINRKKTEKIKSNTNNKIITFSGNYKSGKSTLSLLISQYLSERNNKVLIIDGDIEKQDLSFLLRKNNKKNINYLKEKYIIKKNILKNKRIRIKKNYYLKKLINLKNTIYYYQIKNLVNINTKKINKNLYFFSGLNYLLKNNLINKENKIKKIIYIIFKIIKKRYNIIIVDLSKNNGDAINKEILKNSNINFICFESNLLEIKEVDKLLKVYLKEWNISKKTLYFIINKKNFISINKRLISNYLSIKNKIFEIKENKFYSIFINQYFKRKIILKNKIIKREINKIIYKIMKINN